MRKPRIVEVTAAYYHVISRVVGRERLFGTAEERERFTKTMRQVEGFCGVQVLAFTEQGDRLEWHLVKGSCFGSVIVSMRDIDK